MRYDEAVALGEWLSELSLSPGSICLNIGSSTERFRTISQPHIDRFIFTPLRRAGIKVVHCDLKEDSGVDLVGDVLEPAFQQKLRDLGASLLICSNLLEHLVDPRAFAAACGSLLAPGGYAVFTVPRSYPYHPDPIDPMFRPSPEQFAQLFPQWHVIKAEELSCGNLTSDLRRSKRPLRACGHYLARLLTPVYRPRFWLSYAHRALWLVRKYKVTMLLIRKPPAAG